MCIPGLENSMLPFSIFNFCEFFLSNKFLYRERGTFLLKVKRIFFGTGLLRLRQAFQDFLQVSLSARVGRLRQQVIAPYQQSEFIP